jgi:cytolysin-activating lysine-acyltransferase
MMTSKKSSAKTPASKKTAAKKDGPEKNGNGKNVPEDQDVEALKEKLAAGQSGNQEALDKLKATMEGVKKAGAEAQAHAAAAAQGNDMTVARMLGEIVWVLTQSPTHKHFALSDLKWMVMPPLSLEQYRIFRAGTRPLGVAFWAYLSDEAEQKLLSGAGRLRPDEWAVGMRIEPGAQAAGGGSASKEGGAPERGGSSSSEATSGSSPHITKEEGGTLWLVDLVCPFHTPENKLADKMLADLITGPFKGKKFKFHHTDPATGKREVKEIGG